MAALQKGLYFMSSTLKKLLNKTNKKLAEA
jgi:hypothetical protein